jgi:D-psicose/D-tagatose/L-ribulose 3-epimerase
MRLAISNIAWDTEEDSDTAALLRKYDIDAIDIAPGKYFPHPLKASSNQIRKVRAWWVDQGVEITGMQSLLFGTSGFNVFGDTGTQEKMLEHLYAICRIGGELGATRIVFGSPRNRDRQNLSDETSQTVASEFFRKLGDRAEACGVMVCLEPNPPVYGSNFMINSFETERMVRLINHPAIRMQFDTGSVLINQEDPQAVLSSASPLIGHIHLSEPQLVPLGDSGLSHAAMAKSLHHWLPQALATIEMVATTKGTHIEAMTRAITFARAQYSLKTTYSNDQKT